MENQNISYSKHLIDYAITIRKADGITTKEVAERAGVASQHISRIESGKHSITLASFLDYIEGIGCEVNIKRKDGRNDYQILTKRLLSALDNNDKSLVDQVISDMRKVVRQDSKRTNNKITNQPELLVNINDKDVSITTENKEGATSARRLQAYNQTLKGGK